MASELGGLIIGGGLILASSLFSASYNECKIDFASKDEAIKLYNSRFEKTVANGEDVIVLAPCFGDTYSPLRYMFTSLGFQLTSKPGDQFVTIDLTRLIRSYPSFESERKLSAALFEAGLVLSPGEANGLEEPGYFRMFCSVFSNEQIEVIRSKLVKVIQDFQCSDPHAPKDKAAESTKRLASQLSSNVTEAESASIGTKRSAPAAPKTPAAEKERPAPKTADKRRRTTKQDAEE